MTKMSCCTSFQASWPKVCNSAIDDDFVHIDLRNVMVPLMVLCTSHDANNNVVASHDTNASGIILGQC